uniref:NADH dehydrogenase subunit 2 n=1 Tax=Erronea errones TaxID=218440 RepID=UPI0021820CFF|nr:NADH dehydrogenase subunit 2 [Erronea errones]YP_010713640.1 NADH dehydrogenase subunit 2 [Erronea caurica]UVG40736.1 NADH dehydrogenase subunit 2 [Erronea errones]WDA98772.1 NADH dehydrogenase subunit 2 [Erronea caurica]
MFSSLPFMYMFFSVMGIGTLFSISSLHWLGIWAGLEINLIGFLPILVYQKSMSESESAVKYFVVQALGSSLLIFGSLNLYSLSFTWEMLIPGNTSSTISLFILIMGLFVKLGLFPFHFWLPSVMAGLPWLSCLLLATWQKLAPLCLSMSLFQFSFSYGLLLLICLISAGSSLIGGIGGVNQTQVRALLAYSSIGHLGWIMFGLMHSEWVMKIYFMIYVFISFCLFMSLWYSDSGMMKNLDSIKSVGLNQTSVMLMLLSLGGLPPLLGFISKWLVMVISINNYMWSFVFLLILGSLMSLFYYLGLFFSLFLNNLKKNSNMKELINKSNFFLMMLLLMNLFGGLLIIMMNVLETL